MGKVIDGGHSGLRTSTPDQYVAALGFAEPEARSTDVGIVRETENLSLKPAVTGTDKLHFADFQ